MNKNWLKILVAISAILIAGSAAYFSVTGLGVLFSGAAIAVMVMAGSLEFAKLVTATYLKQEWDNVSGISKWYLTSSVVILMVITSAGIFGYLSNAFQQQNLKLEQVQREIDVWYNKISTDTSQISLYTNQLNQLQSNNNTVLGNNTNRNSLRFATSTSKEQSKIRTKISALNDSILIYNSKINDIKNANISIEREVGGFRFVAEAFGVELKSVVKFFIILIVVVFDPLAVALVISFNQLVSMPRKKEDEIPSNPEDLKAFVDETSRLRLSEEDLNKIEEVLLNPPAPNQSLEDAANEYNQKLNEMSQDVWGRTEAIDEEPYAGLKTPYVSDNFTIGPDGAFEMTEEIQKELQIDNVSDWDSTLMDGLEDEEPFFTEEEMQNILQDEPTTEEENENFSIIEAIPTNIFQEEDGWTEELEQKYWAEQENTIEEPITFNEQSIQEEVEEMISQALSTPPIEDNVIHAEIPNNDSEIESEKKKS